MARSESLLRPGCGQGSWPGRQRQQDTCGGPGLSRGRVNPRECSPAQPPSLSPSPALRPWCGQRCRPTAWPSRLQLSREGCGAGFELLGVTGGSLGALTTSRVALGPRPTLGAAGGGAGLPQGTEVASSGLCPLNTCGPHPVQPPIGAIAKQSAVAGAGTRWRRAGARGRQVEGLRKPRNAPQTGVGACWEGRAPSSGEAAGTAPGLAQSLPEAGKTGPEVRSGRDSGLLWAGGQKLVLGLACPAGWGVGVGGRFWRKPHPWLRAPPPSAPPTGFREPWKSPGLQVGVTGCGWGGGGDKDETEGKKRGRKREEGREAVEEGGGGGEAEELKVHSRRVT